MTKIIDLNTVRDLFIKYWEENPRSLSDIATFIGIAPGTLNRFLEHPEMPMQTTTLLRINKWLRDQMRYTV